MPKLCKVFFQYSILSFECLGMSSGSCASGDSIGSPAFAVVLQAWRASTRSSIAANFADLCTCQSIRPQALCSTVILTLQRSQACPVRVAPASFFLTVPEKSPLPVRWILLAVGVPSWVSLCRFVEGMFRRDQWQVPSLARPPEFTAKQTKSRPHITHAATSAATLMPIESCTHSVLGNASQGVLSHNASPIKPQ